MTLRRRDVLALLGSSAVALGTRSASAMSTIRRDVCIVGGGAAGVYAALRLRDLGLLPVVSAALVEGVDAPLENALDIGARTIRLGLSPVLCGDRDAFGAARWAQLIAEVRAALGRLAPAVAERLPSRRSKSTRWCSSSDPSWIECATTRASKR